MKAAEENRRRKNAQLELDLRARQSELDRLKATLDSLRQVRVPAPSTHSSPVPLPARHELTAISSRSCGSCACLFYIGFGLLC